MTAPGLGTPTQRRRALDPLLLVAGLCGFGWAMVRTFPQLVNALTYNADLVSPMVIADTLATARGPQDVVFGTYAPYTTLWFNMLTRRLPFHRELWEAGPLLLSLVGVGLLIWVARRLAGWWAALATAAIGLVWSQPVIITLVAQAIHGTTYFVLCLLAAFLALIAGRPRSPGVTIAATAGVGVVAGVNLASDALLLLVGIAPLVGAPVLAAIRSWSRPNRRALVVAGAAGVVAIVVSGVTVKVMEAAGYRATGVSESSPLALASLGEMVDNVRRLGGYILDIWSADFLGEKFDVTTIPRAVLAVPALAAVTLPVALLARALWKPGPSGELSPVQLYFQYWGLVVSALVAGLIVSELAVENAYRAVNYLTPVVLAVAATLPIVAARARWSRIGVGVLAGLFCALCTYDMIVPPPVRPGVPALAYVAEGAILLDTLERHDLRRGYAGYVSASVYTYQSVGRLVVRPVQPCLLAPGRLSVCGFYANRVAGWYLPHTGVRTFLITDPSLPAGVATAPVEFGPPSEVIPIGVQTIFVYPYDIASRFGPTL